MPKLVDHAERRQEFIEASLGVIANEGLDSVTLRRVAGDAGFTTGAIAHYFESRRDLLIAALRQAHQSTGTRMARAAKSAKSPRELLRAVVLEALPMTDISLREWRVWVAFWGAAVGDTVLAEENAERYAEWRNLIADLCRAFVGERACDALAFELLAAIDGLGLQIALTLHSDAKALRSRRRQAREFVDSILLRWPR